MTRELELILTHNGGAELVDLTAQQTVWASDSDDDFREEFVEFLDENDIEAVLDWLIDNDHLSDEEADMAEISIESLEGEKPGGPGDDEDDDDDDEEDMTAGEFYSGIPAR